MINNNDKYFFRCKIPYNSINAQNSDKRYHIGILKPKYFSEGIPEKIPIK